MKRKSGLGKFVAGIAIGAGLGVLFAPQEGAKTRAQLKKKLDELAEKIKTIDPSEIKLALETKIAEIKADLQDLDGEKVLSFAKDKAQKIGKKCDELVKLAVEKGTPIVKKTAEEVRLKTIKVLENTIDKLEKKEPVKETVKTKQTVKKKNTSKK